MDKPYSSLRLYYLSGTGNALSTVRWMAETAAQQGLQAELIPIDRQKTVEKPESQEKMLIGFCYPTHGFGTPWLMLKFFLRFPKIKNADVFLSSTRAGSKLSKIFLPGINGMAMWLPFLLLLLKGYRIKGLLPVDLPSNWILLHPGYRQKVIASMFRRCEGIVKRFAGKLISGGRYYHYWVFIFLPLDVALIPITLMYQVFGRFFLAKLFIATDKCTGCGLCYEKCPAHAIRMYGKKPYWTLHCESCMRCINLCPEKAIQVSHLLLAMIIIVVMALPFYDIIFRFFGAMSAPAYEFTETIVRWGLTLIIFVAVYGMVFLLLKFRIFSLLFEYTSLTRYWRKYTAPGIKAADFKIMKPPAGEKNN